MSQIINLHPQTTPQHKNETKLHLKKRKLSSRHFSNYIIQAIATGYCLRGRTATGTKPKRGTVAVDPRLIPLYSKVYVEGYGWARAEDTGSAIKGRRIDVWFPSRDQALKWGVKKVKVYIFR